MDRNLKLLSQREELQLKKEVERLCKQSQKDFLHYTQQISSSSRKRTSPTVMVESVPVQSPQTDSFKRTRNYANASKKKNTLVSKNFVDSPEVQKDILNSSPTFLLGDPKPERFLNQVKDLKAMIKGVAACYQEDKGHENYKKQKKLCEDEGLLNSGTSEHADKAARKPVIALIDGTTKAVTISKRPQPPQRPKYKPVVWTRARILKSPFIEEVEKPISINKPKTSKVRMQSTNSQKSLKTESSSNDSDHSDDSLSEDSEDSASPDDSGKEKNKRMKKQKKFKTERPISVVPDEVTVVEPGIPGSRKSSVGSSHSQSVRSTSQLLEEAKDIARTGASIINKQNIQHRKPKEDTAKLPVRESGRTTDEVIASLQSGSHTDSLSTSDQMVKELTEKVLGHSSKCEGGESEAWALEAPGNQHIPTEGSALSAEPQPLSPDQTSRMFTEIQAEQQVSVKDVEETENGSVDLTSMIRSKDTPFSLDLSFPCEQDSSEIDDLIKISQLPKQVTYSDIIQVKGVPITMKKKQILSERKKSEQQVSFLATWTPTNNKSQKYKTIHHLCTISSTHILTQDLQRASGLYLMPNITPAADQVHQVAALSHYEATEKNRILQGAPLLDIYQREKEYGVRILQAHSKDSLTEWQQIAEYYVERPRMQLLGKQAAKYMNASRMFWKPAPPKFTFAPSFVQDKIFPNYQETKHSVEGEELYCGLQDLNESEYVDLDAERRAIMLKVLSRKHKSTFELRSTEDLSLQMFTEANVKSCLIRKSISAPNLSTETKTELKVPADFKTLSNELELAKLQQLSRSKPQAKIEVSSSSTNPLMETPTAQFAKLEAPDQINKDSPVLQPQIKGKMSNVEAARNAGMKYIIHPRKKKTTQEKKKLSPQKLAFVHDKFNQPARTLTRCKSLLRLHRTIEPSLRVPEKSRHYRSSSLPLMLNFERFTEDHDGIPENVHVREWVRDIWNSWFDEVFPPPENVKVSAAKTTKLPYTETKNIVEKPQPDEEKPVPDQIDLSLAFGPSINTADLQNEIDKITQYLAEEGSSNAFNFCRRGALYKKMGNLKLALEDLNKSISIEPGLLDAYWHRHCISLLKGNQKHALDDLHFIIKHNKNHADAYMSKAEIYRSKGDITMSIVNYTRAIKARPEDDEAYFRRAQMFEKSNEKSLAIDDYAKASTINPKRTDALMIHGLHFFKNLNWSVAIQDFTAVMKHEPLNAKARTYRGRAYAKQGHYQQAVEDLSAAVHLDPNNWIAFYHRGCLLRKSHGEIALRDLSVSVLINDGVDNLNAFLHRGILYTELNQWMQAICDFEHVLKLDRYVAVAHMNLGLIFMLKMENHYEAIRRFTSAIKIDPTCNRAYVCRAEAYNKVHDLQRALKDVTQAIHLQPDTQHLYIMRGEYLCKMKKFELASFCIHYAAEMNKALGSSPIQQAAVQSFLGNNTKAIDCLVSAIKTCSTPPVIILLGKTQMKAKKYKEAVKSFKTALDLLSAKEGVISTAPEAAEIFHLIGLCYMRQVNLLQALEAFTSAVKINPEHADAFYQRGLCKMRLQQATSVHDFNRALAANPNLFQVYLSRAAFYGEKCRYSKAVLNCNEAIKIHPKSVRAYLYRGALKFYMKVYKNALEDLTTAINLDNMCTLAYYNRGVCYQQTEQYEKALKDYGIVLLLGSRQEVDLKVLINRGLLYAKLNDHHNALLDFKAATMINPEDPAIFNALGICHHRLGQLAVAIDAFNQAIKLKPFFLDAYVGRGNVYMDYGHEAANKQAQRDFLTALHLNPACSKARINLGYNFQVFGNFKKAWNQFTVVADIDPTCSTAYEGRSVINLQMGNTFAAFQDVNTALKLNKASDELITNRGVIHQFMGDHSNAMKDYKRAITINPHYALAYFNAANIYFYNRQFEQASEYYTKAFDLDPSNESSVLNRAITRTLLRNVQGALEDFKEALNLSPFSAQIYFNRANLYISLKQYQLAENDLSQALLLQPHDALVYKLRADVRGQLGLTEQAILDYKQAVELQEATQAL
ncbi:uncharacterized protein LOC117963899 [Acipenser ruthenus]|uniref:uncharacterized protein LOC117963899 n=1 Tax=Acipenser ruthenus TaxID=7906 RepID=UPI002740D9A6|nr:uncharacterized protein LOC117963899 [Acipenser ruthenus]XP_058847629.1 uncharacterized protein LOC117963899 [Acipenser ruthenus]